MQFYGYPDPNPSEIELNNRELAKRSAEEGIVLLKNNDVLPLKNKKIALYGNGARFTQNCGLGSGSLEVRYDVNVEEGLKKLGYEISTQKWLDDYDKEQQKSYQDYRNMVNEKIVGIVNPMEVMEIVGANVYRYPNGRLIDENDIQGSSTDTVIYVLSRQSGEGNDRKLEKGDFYITDVERSNLEIISKSYSNTILVINSGGIIDLSFLDEINIGAVIHYTQGGEEGGNALASLLSGKQNFSGKLVDTIPLKYDDIPFGKEYSYLNGDLNNEYYKEGIYVGYRYYDSFHKDVRFPFGFGLSYASFKIETKDVKFSNHFVNLSIQVTNTGKFAGKEVVQIYVSVPGVNKEYQRLVEFHKTKDISPNETENCEISFDFLDCASYSESEACWILDSGSYLVRVGNSSRNTNVVASIDLPEKVNVLQCKNCCSLKDKFEELKTGNNENKVDESNSQSCKIIKVDPKSFTTEKVDYQNVPRIEATAEEKSILDSLATDEQIELLVGGDLFNLKEGAHDIILAAGKTTMNLIPKGIRNLVFSDGPAGLNIANECCYKSDSKCVPVKIPEKFNWGEIGKSAEKNMCSRDGTLIYRYATCWPVSVLLAQTWNRKLLEEVGVGFRKEMEKYGISVLLAPALNIHRNPLCGRTFEYFSEDPLISGAMAAAITNGVQKSSNAAVSLKHFCCNNCEDNRKHSSSNISERALREIYLKGFEIAVKKSSPKTIMSSYNMLNHVYTSNNKELLTDILRGEWKFDGLVMTDWFSCTEGGDPSICPLAGNDLVMPGDSYSLEKIRDAYKKGNISSDQIRNCALRVLRLILNGVTEVRMNRLK